MNNIIEIDQLTRKFGANAAVENLSLNIPAGSIFAFLGPNGAGKTTTIKMLMNILEPTSGVARVLGRDSRTLGAAEFARIAYVSENQKLPEWMTVRQFINYCRPFYPTWDEAFCERLTKQFDLPLDRKLRGLSRGMKVKAALLTSLAYRPQLLVLDEPFSGLDPLVRDEFIRGVMELSEEQGWTVFISSHDIDEVERLADRVGVVNQGRLEVDESIESLQQRFRRMEFSVTEAGPPPLSFPPEWLRVDSAGHGFQIINQRYREGESEAALARFWPDATALTVSPLSLREIFLELSRGFRIGR